MAISVKTFTFSDDPYRCLPATVSGLSICWFARLISGMGLITVDEDVCWIWPLEL